MNEQEQIPDITDAVDETKAQQADNGIYTTPDVYQTQTGQDVYGTPNAEAEVTRHDTGGMFSGDQSKNQAGGQQYGGGSQYNGDNMQYGSGWYANGNNPYSGGQYDSSRYANGNNPYNGGQYTNGNNQYYGGQYQYGNNQYQNPYGASPYGNNPYSPYATPPAKKHTGLIIGVIITGAILFLIAVFTLFYHILDRAIERKEINDIIDYYDSEMNHDDEDYHGNNYDNDYNDNNYNDDNYGHHNDDYDYHDGHHYDYDDDYHDNYGYYDDYDDDEYYTLHDDIKENLSYAIEWEYYEYEPDDSDVIIVIDYPVVVGNRVPNLDRINEVLADEVAVFTEYYEDEYANYMYGEDSYFYATATGYVTYMSEDVLSVVFSETIYSDYYDSIYCYSINIDMRDGIIMDNTDIITVDDDFSVDFRYRSDRQNGNAVEWASDQEITEFLTSPENLIIYYVPQGMEIGFNYDEGWITVTYHDYEDFLKIF
ncbi:MAG: hypothetical protein NC231_05205 [Bacillus sp. (in: Bacteria)]|nr:hypothetical protein [Bacillus sp. (in: firmicutes)]MCM1425143.1 hypothetical protein [Eubacterium sp.]